MCAATALTRPEQSLPPWRVTPWETPTITTVCPGTAKSLAALRLESDGGGSKPGPAEHRCVSFSVGYGTPGRWSAKVAGARRRGLVGGCAASTAEHSPGRNDIDSEPQVAFPRRAGSPKPRPARQAKGRRTSRCAARRGPIPCRAMRARGYNDDTTRGPGHRRTGCASTPGSPPGRQPARPTVLLRIVKSATPQQPWGCDQLSAEEPYPLSAEELEQIAAARVHRPHRG